MKSKKIESLLSYWEKRAKKYSAFNSDKSDSFAIARYEGISKATRWCIEDLSDFLAKQCMKDQRDILRDKQDKVIAIAKDRNCDTDIPISSVQEGAPSINDLKIQLYPSFEPSMNAFMEYFNEQQRNYQDERH